MKGGARTGRLKIVMVAACPFPANHGSAASIREMSEALVALGHQVHVVTYPMREGIPLEGVSVHRIQLPFVKPGAVRIGPSISKLAYDFLLIFKLLEVMVKHGIDVIHAHNYEAALIGWAGKLLGRRPLLYNAVTTMREELPTYDFIKPRKAAELLGGILDYVVPRAANAITVVSDELGDYLIRGGIPRPKVRVVPAGVNLQMFAQADGTRVRQRHGLVGVPVVMYTGAFERFQRIDYLLLAMQWLAKRNPQARLLIVGNVKNPARLMEYRHMASDLGIGGQVSFLDAVPFPDVPDYIAAADVTVVPRTDCPGHPVKLLNYMAAAKPIVSFKGAGKGLHHLHNAYLAQDHDCAALGRGLEFLLERPEMARTLGERARDTIHGAFDWDTLTRGIELIYREMLEDHSGLGSGRNPYLKSRYVLQYPERRTAVVGGKYNRSGVDRRQRNLPIETLERRKMVFPAVDTLVHTTQAQASLDAGPACEPAAAKPLKPTG